MTLVFFSTPKDQGIIAVFPKSTPAPMSSQKISVLSSHERDRLVHTQHALLSRPRSQPHPLQSYRHRRGHAISPGHGTVGEVMLSATCEDLLHIRHCTRHSVFSATGPAFDNSCFTTGTHKTRGGVPRLGHTAVGGSRRPSRRQEGAPAMG